MATNPFSALDNDGVATHTKHALMNDNWPKYKALEIDATFVGDANENGDYDGTGNPSTLLSVTGTVEIAVIAVCTTNLAGASATIELGTAKNTAGVIAQTTATDVDALEIWHDASPDASVEASSVVARKIVTDDVIITVGTANITAGVIKFIVLWTPLSVDGDVSVGADYA